MHRGGRIALPRYNRMLQMMPANTSVSAARNLWLLSGLSIPTRLTAIFDLPGRRRMSPE